MIVENLAGIFTGAGFAKHEGRKPSFDDAGFIPGPVDMRLDDHTGRFVGVEKTPARHPTKSVAFDGTGLVATAGFNDSHTHALFAGERNSEYFLRWRGATYSEVAAAGGGIHNTTRDTEQCDHEKLRALMDKRLRGILRAGTTTLEIKSGYGATSASEINHLRFIKTLRALAYPDLRATFLALHALPIEQNETAYVSEMISALETVKNEGLADFVDVFPERGFFSLKEALRFTRAAKSLGLRAKVHADEITDMKASETFIYEGAVSIDHLQKMNPTALALLATAKTVATLLPATSFFLNLEYSSARTLIDSGARVALATDFNPGTAPEAHFQFTNLLAASQLKMSAAEILCASTYNGAAALGLEGDRGTLENNRRADILLWQADGRQPQSILESIFLRFQIPAAVIANGRLLAS